MISLLLVFLECWDREGPADLEVRVQFPDALNSPENCGKILTTIWPYSQMSHFQYQACF